MADVSTEELKYPLPNLLTVYADGILSIAQTREIVKLYLAKNDNPINGEGDPVPATVAQIILPMSGFVNSYAFMDATINRYLRIGYVEKEEIDKMKKSFADMFGQKS